MGDTLRIIVAHLAHPGAFFLAIGHVTMRPNGRHAMVTLFYPRSRKERSHEEVYFDADDVGVGGDG